MKASSAENRTAISAVGLSKIYPRGREKVSALNQVSFDIETGEFVAIAGPSGAGKSTLLNLIGCMDIPTEGKLTLLGQDVHRLRESERTRFRRDQLGFVFQHFGLIPTLTVAENVALPALFAGRDRRERVDELLQKVGLGHRREHLPQELSGGEMQRVAIARALVNVPALLLADEPTGNLDSRTGGAITDLFQQLNQEGLTIVVVTHNASLAEAAERILQLVDGRLHDSAQTALSHGRPVDILQTGSH